MNVHTKLYFCVYISNVFVHETQTQKSRKNAFPRTVCDTKLHALWQYVTEWLNEYIPAPLRTLSYENHLMVILYLTLHSTGTTFTTWFLWSQWTKVMHHKHLFNAHFHGTCPTYFSFTVIHFVTTNHLSTISPQNVRFMYTLPRKQKCTNAQKQTLETLTRNYSTHFSIRLKIPHLTVNHHSLINFHFPLPLSTTKKVWQCEMSLCV